MIETKRKIKKKEVLLPIINMMVGILIISPILYALGVSLMEPGQVFEYPPKIIPRSFYIQNYKDVLRSVPIIRYLFNSMVVSVAVTAGQVVMASLAAYTFSFFEFKGKSLLFVIILSTMMIPWEATIIANYLTISAWGWLDTYQAFIVPYLTTAMGIFLMRQYYLTLPKELQEAATIDGCGSFRFFTSIVIPLSKPAVGSLGVYAFLSIWNQYLWPLLITNNDTMRTVQIGITRLQDAEAQAFGVVMAGIMWVLLPSILVFILGQKQLLSGMTSGAVKG